VLIKPGFTHTPPPLASCAICSHCEAGAAAGAGAADGAAFSAVSVLGSEQPANTIAAANMIFFISVLTP